MLTTSAAIGIGVAIWVTAGYFLFSQLKQNLVNFFIFNVPYIFKEVKRNA